MRFIVSILLCILLFSIKDTYAQFPYTDTFRNSIATGTVVGGSALLTAGSIDPEGEGYLRLTANIPDQAGYARNISQFPTNKGLLVTFEYYSYGGNETETADGICFFLFDADVLNLPADAEYPQPGFSIGGIGGSLGYAGKNGTPGLRRGFLGIGFDEFGNFATDDNGHKEGTIPFANRVRQNVTLRGAGNGTSNASPNYKYLTHVETDSGPTPFKIEGKVSGRPNGLTPADPGYRKATVEILPNGANSFKINVWITVGGTATPHHVITDYIYNETIPARLSYGLAASTGGYTNFHEVRAIDIVIPPSVQADPVAVNDSKSTPEDTPVSFNIIQNDYDPNGNGTLDLASVDLIPTTPAIDKSVTKAGEGTYTVDNLGVVTFTPVLNFTGAATPINYRIKDNSSFKGSSNDGEISISVTPVNDAPLVTGVEVTGAEDQVITFTAANFTSKYSDVDNDPMTRIKVVTVPGTGTLKKSGSALLPDAEIVLAELPNITFTPALNFYGATSFLWTASDGNAFSPNGTVNINITPVDNDAPTAVNDAGNTETGRAVTIDVVANDIDPDGPGLLDVTSLDIDPAGGTQTTFTVNGQGTYVANNNGTVTFTPEASYQSGAGTATPITYTVKDKTGLTSTPAQITIKVAPKTAPVANSDEATTSEDASVAFSLIANDTDLNGNSTIDATSIDLNPDQDGRQAFLTVAGQGTYSVNSAGMLTFVPAPNYNSGAGTATSISYTIKDRDGLTSNISSITVTVTPVSDAPVATADVIATNEDNLVTINVIANDTDAEGNSTIDLASIDFDLGPEVKKVLTIANEGTYTANTNGTVTFVPLANYSSSPNTATPVSYTIKDIEGNTSLPAMITVTVIPVNDPPTVANVSKSGPQGKPIAFTDTDFKSKFTDPENAALVRIKVVNLPLNGSLKLYGASVKAGDEILVGDLEGITFVPLAGYNGTTSFAWNGYDGTAYAALNATVVINIAEVNQPPVLSTVVKSHTGNQPVSFTATDFTSQFTDPDGNTLAKIKIVSLPSSGSLKLYGVEIVAGQEIALADVPGITFTAAPGSSGAYSFSWNGFDGKTYATTPATIVLNVSVANQPPVVSDINKSGTGFTQITFLETDFTSKFTDADNNTLVKAKIVSLPANGVLKLNGLNVFAGQEIPLIDLQSLIFQPALNWSGTTIFSWNGYDGKEYAANNASVSISILLPSDPNAKLGLAKKLTSITDGINGSYNLKFLFTLVNFGPNAVENISLTDNLGLLFAGTEFSVKTVSSLGNLKSNASYNGSSITDLLLPISRLNGGEEAQVELEINVRLLASAGTFHNYAIAEGSSAITGAKVVDRSTNGVRPDPVTNGDVTLSETTPVELAARATFVPEGFTPNNDGINDYLIIQNTLNQKVAVEIFNRWGNRIYKASEYKNDWSGKCTEGVYLGQDIPDGTYFYVVTVAGKEKYVGSLTVQR